MVLPGYRLGPEGIYPHMLEDGAAAVAWTAANVSRYGGDPDQGLAEDTGGCAMAALTIVGPTVERDGEILTDAALAALCIEHGLELISNDSDFARFPEIRWQNPLT